VETKLQLADIFTKSLPKERFFFLRNELGILILIISLKSVCGTYESLFVKTNRGSIIGSCISLSDIAQNVKNSYIKVFFAGADRNNRLFRVNNRLFIMFYSLNELKSN